MNSDIFTESTEEIVGSWGTTKICVKVVKALTSAVKEPERTNDIAHPKTFNLLKSLPKYSYINIYCFKGLFAHKTEFMKVIMKILNLPVN